MTFILLFIHSLSVVLFADSSLRVKDVIKEFHAGGRLAQHSFGEVSHAKINDTRIKSLFDRVQKKNN